MKKSIFLTALLSVFFVSLSFAQKFKNEKIQHKEIQLPRTQFADSIDTYSTEINLNSLRAGTSRTATTNSFESAMKIGGFKKVESDGDLELRVNFQDMYGVYKESFTKKEKEKRGDKEVEVTKYGYNVFYRMKLRFSVYKDGEEIENEYISGSQDQQVDKTRLFDSSTERAKWWKDNGTAHINNIKKSRMRKLTSDLTARVKAFSFVPVTKVFKYNVPEHKKHDYTDFQEINTIVKEAYAVAKVTRTTLGAEFDTKMTDALVKWEAILQESDVESKKSRVNKKVTIALMENMAMGYYAVRDFEKALDIIAKAKEIKSKTWQRTLKGFIEVKQARLEKYYSLNGEATPNE